MARQGALYCPRCQSVWSIEEIEEQYCDACGYPNTDSMPEYDPDYIGPDDPCDETVERKEAAHV